MDSNAIHFDCCSWKLSCILRSVGKIQHPAPHSISRFIQQVGAEVERVKCLPLEKVLEKRVKLEDCHTGEVYWVRVGSTLDLIISVWQREHGAEDGGVEGKKALGNTEKTVLDLHPKRGIQEQGQESRIMMG